jgi:alkylated DNA repair dioxygenase AlkB
VLASRVASRVSYQASLFGRSTPSFDPGFAGLRRIWLDAAAWVDWLPGWVAGADDLMDAIVRTTTWGQRTRWMYDREVLEPRLTSHWAMASGEAPQPEIVERMRAALSARYGVVFDTIGRNFYRDGRDSVAWHRDRIRMEVVDPVVALVSLGEPRKLHLRPRGGGRSRAFPLGGGDLLVTGGATQRTWEHAVLKAARAGPRVSLAFRHGLDASTYGDPDGGEPPGAPEPTGREGQRDLK